MSCDECRDCGHCMHHVPTKKDKPPKVRFGEGKGQLAFWVCELTDGGRYHTDGKNCEKFESRYDTPKKIDAWVKKVSGSEKGIVTYGYRKVKKPKRFIRSI